MIALYKEHTDTYLIWVDFDPTKGSEQAGHRPAVVHERTQDNS
ncbi:type II toxin-antitoxin system PemK/MazF family toxin, partial [Escherichia sp. TWPC-MK]